MTKAHERGENEVTADARREAARTGEPVCDILRRWREEAARARDQDRLRRVQKAEKYLGCRNRAKRRK